MAVAVSAVLLVLAAPGAGDQDRPALGLATAELRSRPHRLRADLAPARARLGCALRDRRRHRARADHLEGRPRPPRLLPAPARPPERRAGGDRPGRDRRSGPQRWESAAGLCSGAGRPAPSPPCGASGPSSVVPGPASVSLRRGLSKAAAGAGLLGEGAGRAQEGASQLAAGLERAAGGGRSGQRGDRQARRRRRAPGRRPDIGQGRGPLPGLRPARPAAATSQGLPGAGAGAADRTEQALGLRPRSHARRRKGGRASSSPSRPSATNCAACGAPPPVCTPAPPALPAARKSSPAGTQTPGHGSGGLSWARACIASPLGPGRSRRRPRALHGRQRSARLGALRRL